MCYLNPVDCGLGVGDLLFDNNLLKRQFDSVLN